ncbi:Putative outer membrane TonB-dependent receptor [Pseudomonas chlororaphis subsp. aurantiaca]|uniref:putative porin n=1 Tax=Pseudomonas chlororaphis TaxID=587753 RepID=UPI00050D6C3B|nr:putative porin [Pseudomonas chlororaphis]AIS13201.1 membrane protein [Pseudomonas chlororaphis subsp. aurantiaca]AZD35677.1 Putative outer membrane TonB-dependent receptor [Pseudomonas chlororaphis subsp. aurantiaca]AZD42012.1 Putative outer membrane TonB-dependent receptor [Pseudomonas chlororaphis subsp. aurantiaca]AZD66695.1 Putative outer membrane TonB-dependent receptor [Pseudomonas chlororaphis subsp. aurantiaca]AZD79404.1 Putative outer membrane TonB-dependent receptor [Pseudomonas c
MISNVNRLSLAIGMVIATLVGPVAAAPAAPSENATINLIRLLVQQGVLKQEQADGLIAQAEREAQQARQANTAVAAGPAATPGDVRVQYVPAIVRDQIRDQVKAEVMATAKQENWAQPNTFPDWVSRISFDGDIRLRDESRYYSGSNSNEIVDFAKLNDKGPYDVNPNSSSNLPPLLNTREDRENLFRLRARLGMKAQVAEDWTAGIRIGTGSDNNPVSTTQTLGGGFGKKDIWLDQGYLTWKATDELTLTGGRIANPFFSTDLLYSNDLNFDGVAAIFNHKLNRDWGLFGTVGAFPVEYTNDTSTSNGFDKEESDNKWLYGAQIGANWAINSNHRLKGALAYYRFDDIEGQRSSACEPWAGAPGCDSDGSRVAFMQKGNSVFLLRDITPNPLNPAATAQPQFVGLASEFNLLDLNLVWDADLPENFKLRSQANYIHNLGYDEGEMRKRSEGQIVNNLDSNGELESGANAWMVQFTLGNSLELAKQGDWNLFAGYKYIQPDALPDGFNDSSFHLGGTNAKGYFLGGNYGLAKNVFATGRWLSSEAVYGAPFDIDVLQLEINTRF